MGLNISSPTRGSVQLCGCEQGVKGHAASGEPVLENRTIRWKETEQGTQASHRVMLQSTADLKFNGNLLRLFPCGITTIIVCVDTHTL